MTTLQDALTQAGDGFIFEKGQSWVVVWQRGTDRGQYLAGGLTDDDQAWVEHDPRAALPLLANAALDRGFRVWLYVAHNGARNPYHGPGKTDRRLGYDPVRGWSFR